MSPGPSDFLERMTPAEVIGLARTLIGEMARLQRRSRRSAGSLAGLRVENQALKDEIERLKAFAAASAAKALGNGEGDGSAGRRSEATRKGEQKRRRGGASKLKINQTVVCRSRRRRDRAARATRRSSFRTSFSIPRRRSIGASAGRRPTAKP